MSSVTNLIQRALESKTQKPAWSCIVTIFCSICLSRLPCNNLLGHWKRCFKYEPIGAHFNRLYSAGGYPKWIIPTDTILLEIVLLGFTLQKAVLVDLLPM